MAISALCSSVERKVASYPGRLYKRLLLLLALRRCLVRLSMLTLKHCLYTLHKNFAQNFCSFNFRKWLLTREKCEKKSLSKIANHLVQCKLVHAEVHPTPELSIYGTIFSLLLKHSSTVLTQTTPTHYRTCSSQGP